MATTTLGEHHRQYNKVLRDTIANDKSIGSTQLDPEEDDVGNLLKIDIVCNKKDVQALIQIFKSEDMLYASRAIKRSTWLITDPQYAHIINPEYLHTELLPYMTTKAFKKLLSHVRLNLRDERRVEDFFNYEAAKNEELALKWLPHCSIPFIEEVVKKVRISDELLSRVCEKSHTILNTYLEKHGSGYSTSALESTKFLLTSHTKMYLNAVETLQVGRFYNDLDFGKKYTKLIMSKCPERVFNNYEMYANKLDLKTFVQFIKPENIEEFLQKYSKSDTLDYFFTYKRLRQFILRMPTRSRFNFVTKHFIDADTKKDIYFGDGDGPTFMRARNTKVYEWYAFAPFEVAFEDLKKLIRAESSPQERRAMLAVLISCAGRNTGCVHTLLQYFHDKHINEPFMFKNEFVKLLIEKTDTHAYDDASWNLLNILFRSMEVYKIESANNVQQCIQAIILYNVLHNVDIPDVIQNKFEFNTFKTVQKKLKQHEKEAIFKYLYKYTYSKFDNTELTDESSFKQIVKLIEDLLKVLVDWNESLPNYPTLIQKIKDVANIKKEKGWKVNLSSIYNTKKSWRRYLFEESVVLFPSELVCMNALKHEPGLLARYKQEVEALCCSDAVSLRQVLAKLRVYWRNSLAKQWASEYSARLGSPDGHSALARGLFTLLSHKPLLDVIAKYAPEDNKINWSQENELTLSLRKHIALKMHFARPLIPLDAVLLYAKGDYLQYAVPSLNAVLYNLSSTKLRASILKLLDTPVSLQKFGIRYASTKLEVNELLTVFRELWETSKNLTIRNIVFTLAYDLLCKEKDPSTANALTALICKFIGSLSLEENKNIYKKMCAIQSVPLHVQGELYEKSYVFLQTLPRNDEYAQHLYTFRDIAPKIIDKLNPEFVAKAFLNDMVNHFMTAKCKVNEILVAFILFTADEGVQMKRYEEFLVPLLQLPTTTPELLESNTYIENLQDVLETLSGSLEDYVLKKTIVPARLMADMKQKLEIILPVNKFYVLLTFFKLYVAFAKLLEEHKHALELGSWEDLLTIISPLLADECVKYLKEDVDKYFPSIYIPFAKAMEKFFRKFSDETKYTILRHMCSDESIHTYLLVLTLWPKRLPYDSELRSMLEEIRQVLFSHQSVEMKMHYYCQFSTAPSDPEFEC